MSLKLPAWCAPYIGWPYVKGGRVREGADCIGFFLAIQRERYGREMPEYDGPLWVSGGGKRETRALVAEIGEAAAAFASLFEEVAQGDEQEGDAILLRIQGAPMHIGLIVRRGVMLHLAEGADSCAEDYTQRIWEKRIVGFYRARMRASAEAA